MRACSSGLILNNYKIESNNFSLFIYHSYISTSLLLVLAANSIRRRLFLFNLYDQICHIVCRLFKWCSFLFARWLIVFSILILKTLCTLRVGLFLDCGAATKPRVDFCLDLQSLLILRDLLLTLSVMGPRSLIDPSLIVIVSPMGPIRHRTLVRRVLTCRGTNGVVMRSDLTTLSDVEVVIYILGLSKESFILVAHLLVCWDIFERIYELIATKQLLLYFVSLVIDLLSFLLLLLGG